MCLISKLGEFIVKNIEESSRNKTITNKLSPSPLLTITIFTNWIRSMWPERMFLSLKPQMRKFILWLVLGPIKELSNFCNYSVKITILMVKISSETRKMTWKTSTSSRLLPNKFEIFSCSWLLIFVRYLSFYWTSSWRSLTFLSNRIKMLFLIWPSSNMLAVFITLSTKNMITYQWKDLMEQQSSKILILFSRRQF